MNTHVKEAGFGKRLIAYLIDAVSVIIPTVILFNFVTSTYFFNAIGGGEAVQEMYRFAADSELLDPNYGGDGKISSVNIYSFTDTIGMSNTPSVQKKAGYEEYYDRAWYYYTTFIYQDHQTNGRTIEMANTDTYGTKTFSADDYFSYFERKVMLLPDPATITDVTAESQLAGDKSPYFKYALNDAGTAVDIRKKPVLLSKVDLTKNDTLSSLNTYMYNSAGTNGVYGIYGTAVMDMTGEASSSSVQTYYSIRYSTQNKDIWLSALIVFAPLQLIFFFVIPLCRKKGETLGKMAMSIAVVKSDGFNVTWKEKLIRQFAVATLGMLVMLPWAYIGATLYVLFAVIDYMVLVMSKTHQSLHDRLAKTMAVSKKESLFFDNEDSMGEYASTHLDQFPELQNEKEDAEVAAIAQADSILDLSTLNKNREEAVHMTSFDEYEKKEDEENASKTLADQPKVNLTKEDDQPELASDEQAMKDLAALEGGKPDENGEAVPAKEETSKDEGAKK